MEKRNAKAVEVKSISHGAAAGAYCFSVDGKGNVIGIIHACPCGCGALCSLFFDGIEGFTDRPKWNVSGEWPNASLTPSIGIKYDGAGDRAQEGSFHWHGFLRNGVFEEC